MKHLMLLIADFFLIAAILIFMDSFSLFLLAGIVAFLFIGQQIILWAIDKGYIS